MGRRHTLTFVADHNRQTDAGHERLCTHCEKWLPIAKMKMTHGYHGYMCYACECERQKARNRSDRSGESVAHQHFNERGVHVYGHMVFASLPTPEQLISRRNAA